MNTRTNHGAPVPLERIKSTFTLPTPPPGMKWHREGGWTAEMLPSGTRPLVAGEEIAKGDEFCSYDVGPWVTALARANYGIGDKIGVGASRFRTTRPLTFTHEGHEWTWHRAGDPMPCDGERVVQIMLNDYMVNRDVMEAKFGDWEGESPDGVRIIGWRYADTPQPDPYAELKQAHAEGKVIECLIGGHWMSSPNPSWKYPVETYRIKSDDSPPWIEWHGGECPLKNEEVEEWEFRLQDGSLIPSHLDIKPSGLSWSHYNDGNDIIAYRVLKRHTPKPTVKFGPGDVPPGSVFRWPECSWVMVDLVCDNGLSTTKHGLIEWKAAQIGGGKINRSIPMTGKWNPDAWEPCEK